jgi:hypothetical protein
LWTLLSVKVQIVMPPRERTARERQLRQEAAAARQLAEAEAETARAAASSGGMLRRKPAGSGGTGTLAARGAATILAQLLGAFLCESGRRKKTAPGISQ